MEVYFLKSVASKSAYANQYASFVHNHCTIYRIFCDQKKPSLSSYEGQENSLEEKIKTRPISQKGFQAMIHRGEPLCRVRWPFVLHPADFKFHCSTSLTPDRSLPTGFPRFSSFLSDSLCNCTNAQTVQREVFTFFHMNSAVALKEDS